METPVSEPKENAVLPRIREIVGTIAGAGSAFVALFWLAGRYYAAGYFSAMGIPSFQVSFSVWEYAEVAWFPLALYSIFIVAIGSFAASGLLIFFNPWLEKLSGWLNKKFQPHVTTDSNKIISYINRLFYVTSLACVLGLIACFVYLSLNFVYSSGSSAGRLEVLEYSRQVEIVSDKPQALGISINPSPDINNQNAAFFVYQGFRLLTYNDGKYYLFKSIDPVTCKPGEVYVVDSKQTIQVNILPATSLASLCSKASSGNSQNSEKAVSPTP